MTVIQISESSISMRIKEPKMKKGDNRISLIFESFFIEKLTFLPTIMPQQIIKIRKDNVSKKLIKISIYKIKIVLAFNFVSAIRTPTG